MATNYYLYSFTSDTIVKEIKSQLSEVQFNRLNRILRGLDKKAEKLSDTNFDRVMASVEELFFNVHFSSTKTEFVRNLKVYIEKYCELLNSTTPEDATVILNILL